jgi:hypothetical protein
MEKKRRMKMTSFATGPEEYIRPRIPPDNAFIPKPP